MKKCAVCPLLNESQECSCFDSLKAEVARLTAENERLQKQVETWLASDNQLAGMLAEARKDVLNFGAHLDDCAHRLNPGKSCNCGFVDVIERAMGLTPTEPEAER